MENEKLLRKREINRRNQKRYRERHKERIAKLKHEWYIKHQEETLRKQRERRLQNIDYERQRQKKYYHANREKCIQADKEYRRRKKLGLIPDKVKKVIHKEIKTINKAFKMSEITKVLMKNKRHYLWNICPKNWDEINWRDFENLKNL